MSLQALAQEKFWANKAECEDAEKAYQMRLSGAKGSSPSSLAAEIAKARQHIKNSLECVDGIAAMAGGANADVLKKLKDLEIENKNLKKVTDDLKSMVLKLENRVAALEGGKAAPAAKAPAKDMLEDVEDHNINYRDDIGLGDEKLVTLSTKDLNKMLKKRGISKDRAKEIKRERRTLKNRGYAANCRVKREDEEKSLEQENERLFKLIADNQRKTAEHRRYTQFLKDKFEKVRSEIQEMKRLEEEYEAKRAARMRQGGMQPLRPDEPQRSILSNLPDVVFQKVEEVDEEPKPSIVITL